VLFGAWELGAAELALTVRPFDVANAALGPAIVARGPLEALGRLTGELAAELVSGVPEPGATLVPTPFPALRALGEGLVARDPAARVEGARRALQLAPADPDSALALARLLYDAGRHDEARGALSGLAAGERFERERRFLDGACLLALGRYADADILFAELAARDATAAVLANRAAARLRVLPGRNGATVLLRQALDKAPFATDLAFGLGWAHFVEGDLDDAVYWLRDAVRYAPSDARARLALSWALRGTAHAEEAEEQWRAAAALDASLAGEKAPDATRRLERVFPSEAALLLDPDRRADSIQPAQDR
jgi:Flp pilus assembly protein TadD